MDAGSYCLVRREDISGEEISQSVGFHHKSSSRPEPLRSIFNFSQFQPSANQPSIKCCDSWEGTGPSRQSTKSFKIPLDSVRPHCTKSEPLDKSWRTLSDPNGSLPSRPRWEITRSNWDPLNVTGADWIRAALKWRTFASNKCCEYLENTFLALSFQPSSWNWCCALLRFCLVLFVCYQLTTSSFNQSSLTSISCLGVTSCLPSCNLRPTSLTCFTITLLQCFPSHLS